MHIASSRSGDEPESRHGARAAGKALAVFLVAMALLTAANRALNELATPIVSTASPQRGALEKRIDADGQVQPTVERAVYPPASLPVARVHVRTGQTVSEGEALFTLDQDALRAALDKAGAELDALLYEREKAAGSADGPVDDSAVVTAEQAVARAEEDLAAAHDDRLTEVLEALDRAEKDLADKSRALDWAKADMAERSKDKYNECQAAVDRAQAKFDKALLVQADCEIAYHIDVGGDNAKALDGARANCEALKLALDKAIKKRDRIPGARGYISARVALEAAREAHKKAAEDLAGFDRDSAVRSAQRALEDAKSQLLDKQKALRQMELDVRGKDWEIARKREAVDALRSADEAGGAVLAPIAGQVVSVSVTVGQAANIDASAVKLGELDKGLLLRATVSEEDAGELAVSDQAEISVSGGSYSCAIAAIEPSPTEAGRYELLFELPKGAGQAGQTAQVTIRKRTKNYDAIIPLTALRQDDTNYFVYAVELRDSSLGSQSKVVRRNVNLLDKDGTRAAVSGGVSMGDSLVSRSDREISDGDRVRVE